MAPLGGVAGSGDSQVGGAAGAILIQPETAVTQPQPLPESQPIQAESGSAPLSPIETEPETAVTYAELEQTLPDISLERLCLHAKIERIELDECREAFPTAKYGTALQVTK